MKDYPRQIGLQQQMQEAPPSDDGYKAVSDYTGILGKTKAGRVGMDGTTVIFYSFPKETDQQRNLLPASERTKENILQAYDKIESIGKIRYFDFDNLSDDDRQYLSNRNVKIPPSPDISNHELSSLGLIAQHQFPRANDFETTAVAAYDADHSKKLPDADFQQTAIHESMHGLGFEHPDKVWKNEHSKIHLVPEKDNTGNTVMSYNHYDNCATPYIASEPQKFDIEAIQAKYGVSDRYDPSTIERLNQQQVAREETSKSDFPTFVRAEEAELKVSGIVSEMGNELKKIDKNNIATKHEITNLINFGKNEYKANITATEHDALEIFDKNPSIKIKGLA